MPPLVRRGVSGLSPAEVVVQLRRSLQEGDIQYGRELLRFVSQRFRTFDNERAHGAILRSAAKLQRAGAPDASLFASRIRHAIAHRLVTDGYIRLPDSLPQHIHAVVELVKSTGPPQLNTLSLIAGLHEAMSRCTTKQLLTALRGPDYAALCWLCSETGVQEPLRLLSALLTPRGANVLASADAFPRLAEVAYVARSLGDAGLMTSRFEEHLSQCLRQRARGEGQAAALPLRDAADILKGMSAAGYSHPQKGSSGGLVSMVPYTVFTSLRLSLGGAAGEACIAEAVAERKEGRPTRTASGLLTATLHGCLMSLPMSSTHWMCSWLEKAFMRCGGDLFGPVDLAIAAAAFAKCGYQVTPAFVAPVRDVMCGAERVRDWAMCATCLEHLPRQKVLSFLNAMLGAVLQMDWRGELSSDFVTIVRSFAASRMHPTGLLERLEAEVSSSERVNFTPDDVSKIVDAFSQLKCTSPTLCAALPAEHLAGSMIAYSSHLELRARQMRSPDLYTYESVR